MTILLSLSQAHAQSSSGCLNADFSLGNFTGWSGTAGNYANPNQNSGFFTGVHNIVSTPGIDANTCGGLQMLPPGNTYVARLGYNTFGSTYIGRTLSYTMTVSPSNALFIYKYAVVFHSSGHWAAVQPKFNIQLKDSLGNAIGGNCGAYAVTSLSGIPGFINCGTWQWKDWTTVGLDLSAWMGQQVTVEFATFSCDVGGFDPGYAYIAADCRPLSIDVNYCPGDTSVLLVAPPGFATYSWNTNPPTLNDSLVLTNQNSGDTLTATLTSYSNSTTCSLSLQAIILPTIMDAGFSVSPCENATSFQDTSTALNGQIQSWLWNFGDGGSSTLQNPQHTYADTGTYLVTLKIFNKPNHQGCSDSITLPVQILPKPDAGFSQVMNCIGVPCYFADTTHSNAPGVLNLAWDFGPSAVPSTSTASNPVVNFTFPGTYNISLIATNDFGCKDTGVVAITTANYPHMGFNFGSECAGTAMTFIDSVVTDTNDSVIAWNWDMGDGTFYSTPSVVHTYSAGGVYNVKLTAYSAVGCLDSITNQVQVYHIPNAGFTAADVCEGDPVAFTNTSTVGPPSTLAQSTWLFGDNTGSSLQSPMHPYPGPGTYTVNLSVQSDHGCTGTFSDTITVFDYPQSDFSFNDTCVVDAIPFVNTSQSPSDGSINTFSWQFGDGSPLDQTNYNPSHLYASAGSYTVTLITYSNNLACSDTVSHTVTAHPMPLADFSFNDTCHTKASQFTDQSTGQIAQWNWNFAAGQSSSQQNPANIFSSPGAQNVQLIVTTNHGCSDTIEKQVMVWPLPHPEFLAMNICEGQTNFFYNQSAIPPPQNIVSYMWDFGDSTPMGLVTDPAHNYSTAGDYTITLYAVSNEGCVDSLKKDVSVNHNPVPNFTFDVSEGCYPLCVNFTDQSTIGGGEQIASRNWSFGDGGTAQGNFSTYCYTEPGNYSVRLQTVSSEGCKSEITMTNAIQVYDFPEASFNPEPSVTTLFNPVITFVNHSMDQATYHWNFGDGSVLTVPDPQNPRHTYQSVGSYYVTLIVETDQGCTDSAGYLVLIENESTLYVPNAFTPDNDNVNDIFRAKGTSLTEFEMEIYDRWGLLLFRTDNIEIGWDGQIQAAGNMVPAPVDVYVYSIRARGHKGTEMKKQGHFTLVR